jgi:hypothetical protein
MATLTWTGTNLRFTDPNTWSPAQAPQAGDILFLGSGTADARWTVLSGLTINLQVPTSLAPFPTEPALELGWTVIGADSTIKLGGVSGGRTTASIAVEGNTFNYGTVAVALTMRGPPVPSFLTIDVGGGAGRTSFFNAGTLSSGTATSCMLTVHAASGQARLVNTGSVDVGTNVTLDINVIGQGKLAFGVPFSPGPTSPSVGPTLEATRAVGSGQTVDFAARGFDSHGTLILDSPGNFNGLITNFVASTGNFAFLHTDRIELKGVDISALHYDGTAESGVLTLQNASDTVGHLRFAGSFTTDSFQIVALANGDKAIELKSAA